MQQNQTNFNVQILNYFNVSTNTDLFLSVMPKIIVHHIASYSDLQPVS